jgi:hypothetical protein
MKVAFYASDKPREIMLARALGQAIQADGGEFEIRRTADYGEDDEGNDRKYPGPSPDTDVACAFGVKGKSRQIIEDHCALGIATLYFDKGYSRDKGEGGHTLYSRISVNAADPLAYMMLKKRKPDRWTKLGLRMLERKPAPGGHVLVCCSSDKYCGFHDLGSAHEHAQKLVSHLRKITERHLVYRPKPSQKGVRPVGGASLSHKQSIGEALRGAHCVVTHGTTAAMDAILAGIPAVVLGGSIARPIAETDIEKVDDPFWPSIDKRLAWAAAMAYCQWTADELRSGEAWTHLKAEIQRQAAT